jgi:hypothetical protein
VITKHVRLTGNMINSSTFHGQVRKFYLSRLHRYTETYSEVFAVPGSIPITTTTILLTQKKKKKKTFIVILVHRVLLRNHNASYF